MNVLKQHEGDYRELIVLPLGNAYKWEKKIHDLFGELNIEEGSGLEQKRN